MSSAKAAQRFYEKNGFALECYLDQGAELRLPFAPECSGFYSVDLDMAILAGTRKRDVPFTPPPPPPKRMRPDASLEVEGQLNQLRRSPRKECGLFFQDIGKVAKSLGPALRAEYAETVARPMDLCRVLRRARDGVYDDRAAALADVRLCADNALVFWGRRAQHPAAPIVCAQAEALLEWCKRF